MSRSQPTDRPKNPAVRWFEWNGETGTIRYYDKDAKQQVDLSLPFTFLLLDELSTVRGWHDHSGSGIYANEVRDTRTDILEVKAFKGGRLAKGLYRDIKDHISREGGYYTANCYIGFKNGKDLALGSLRLKGSALGAWMQFKAEARSAIYQKAVTIAGYDEGKKGRIVFRLPIFELHDISDATQESSKALDTTLQAFLGEYLKQNQRDQAEASDVPVQEEAASAGEEDEDPIPF